MSPFRKKIRSLTRKKFLPNLLNNLPDKLDAETLTELVSRLRNGDNSVINTIIEGHVRLAVSIAARYASMYKDKVDDLIGEANLALTKAVHRSRYRLTNNLITPYLVAKIHSAILKYIEEDHTVFMPGRTVRYFVATGDYRLATLPTPIKLVEDDTQAIVGEKYHLPKVENTDIRVLELREVINKVTEGFIEKRIIELRVECHSAEDIGTQVGYSIVSVHRVIREIEERFNMYKA